METSDNPVNKASVRATLTYDLDDDGVFECGGDDTCWTSFGGTTNSNGDRQFKLLNAFKGNAYQLEITSLTHSTLIWESTLDGNDYWVNP